VIRYRSSRYLSLIAVRLPTYDENSTHLTYVIFIEENSHICMYVVVHIIYILSMQCSNNIYVYIYIYIIFIYIYLYIFSICLNMYSFINDG